LVKGPNRRSRQKQRQDFRQRESIPGTWHVEKAALLFTQAAAACAVFFERAGEPVDGANPAPAYLGNPNDALALLPLAIMGGVPLLVVRAVSVTATGA
jgi:hypothetical protein